MELHDLLSCIGMNEGSSEVNENIEQKENVNAGVQDEHDQSFCECWFECHCNWNREAIPSGKYHYEQVPSHSEVAIGSKQDNLSPKIDEISIELNLVLLLKVKVSRISV